jgi:hypothetical protein
MIDRLYYQRVHISAGLKLNARFTELNTPFSSSVKSPFETISSLLASSSSTAQFTNAYFPFKNFARAVVKYTANALASLLSKLHYCPVQEKRKAHTRIQRKLLKIFQIPHNGCHHRPAVKYYRMNVRVFKCDELVEPGEFGEDVAAASAEHEVGSK